MARLQILELPEGSGDDRPPFVLVVDQSPPQRIVLGQGDSPVRDYWQDIAAQIGARGVIVTAETIDIPANDTTAYLDASGDREQAGATEIVYAHERTRLDLCSALLLSGDTTWRDLIKTAAERQRELAGAYQKLDDVKAEPEGDINCRDEVADTGDAAKFYGPKLRHLGELLDEARQWARHGYEIGQKHCGWSDHGVAPAWLTEGWPPHIDSCEHLKRAAELDEAISRVRELHQPVEYRGQTICRECSAYAGSSTDNAPVAYDQCGTLRALLGDTERSPEE